MSNSTEHQANTGQINWLEDAEQGDAPQPLAWRVRTSKRVRNLKIQVFPHGGVEIVAPPRTQPKIIEAFVAEHSDWISKTRSQFAQVRAPEPTLPESIELTALDEAIRIHFAVNSKTGFKETDGLLTIRAPSLHGPDCWPLVQSWLKKRAKQVLPQLCMQTGAAIGLQPKRIHIRLQKTRWGSCSTNGTISLNAALLLRPPEQVHYVLIHELCHLRHMNHSKRYWKLVEKYVPHWQELDKELDKAWQTSPNWLIG
ncbi:MAG: M48 family metallopeptidase [Gammaproteobacteria bacterium]|nr:M48 family metallopeptidase [Gammaproteobacteria bacterium]MCP4091504.1 M48 family metallopeptidase [Gammaproteobacteria bacterium]MCP4275414.1 M48 family metallopeptidase [Gammaproteobacteria bacterium]MCP4832302.1 M48 family metallopeptidase [Gammaproteobacteria bacterium]MCP4928123.1 M48 family metallopeptidase [Gammaproteobacteria bacterium]